MLDSRAWSGLEHIAFQGKQKTVSVCWSPCCWGPHITAVSAVGSSTHEPLCRYRVTGQADIYGRGDSNCSAAEPPLLQWMLLDVHSWAKRFSQFRAPLPRVRPQASFPHSFVTAFPVLLLPRPWQTRKPFSTIQEPVCSFFRQLPWPQRGDWGGAGNTGNNSIFHLFLVNTEHFVCVGRSPKYI